MSRPATPRRTQEERRTETRSRLLDAAVDCLLERGYAATTVAEVQDRAGVARGTLLHHFPTKIELMVAATAHLATDRIDRFRHEAELIAPGSGRLGSVVDLAWRNLNSPSFFAALELWVAARTDAELRAALLPVESRLFTAMHEGLLAVLGEEYAADRRAATVVEFTIDVVTGLSLTTLLTNDLGHRELLLRRWKRALAILLGDLDPDRLV